MRPLPSGNDELAPGRCQALRVFHEFLMHSVRGNGGNHVAAEQPGNGNRLDALGGGVEGQFDCETGQHGSAVLHADLGQRARSRVCCQGTKNVDAASCLGTMMAQDVFRTTPQKESK
jgi:hypothetical protein